MDSIDLLSMTYLEHSLTSPSSTTDTEGSRDMHTLGVNISSCSTLALPSIRYRVIQPDLVRNCESTHSSALSLFIY